MNLYLNNSSTHHPAQKRLVIATLVNKAIKIAVRRHMEDELHFWRNVFMQNGYKPHEIERVMKQQVEGTEREMENEDI